MMQNAGPTGLTKKFDPALLDAFISINDQVIQLYKEEPPRNKADLSYR